MSRPVFDAVAAAGRRHGIEVAGHLPQAVPARHVISAGMGTMEHFLEVVGSVVSPPAVPSLDLAVVFRNVGDLVTQIGERKVDLVAEVDDARLAEVARAFASSETRIVPTLVAMRNFTTAPNGANDDWHRYVSLAQRSSWENGWK
ncbi:MAG: hypothetical protein O9284_15140 [Steroidobacteraceae bacterium]|jgi:hypothetical protein|nr:hypothetical protein [Steroidobacteraceae bacterium]